MVEALPKNEEYGISSQMRRAVISISSNIAEGSGRGTLKDYVHFLYNATMLAALLMNWNRKL